MKVSNSEKKVPDTTTLIHINQYNTNKQTKFREKKIEDDDIKIPGTYSLVTTTVLDTEIWVQIKTLDTDSLVTTTFLNKKISESQNNFPIVLHI